MGKTMIFLGGFHGSRNFAFSSKSFRGDPPLDKILSFPGSFNGGSHLLISRTNPFMETTLDG